MKPTKLILSLSLIFALATTFGFINKQSKQVMIYGIVYTTACKSSETYQNYRHQLVLESSYQTAKELMRKEIQNQFPTATRIRVGSSMYDYGSSATNMCIIKWANTTNNCQYSVLSVHFGKTEQEALNTAISHKKDWADKDAPSSILVQEHW